MEQAENLIKRHEAFLTTMEANDDKINNVVQFAGRLCDEGHFAGQWHSIGLLDSKIIESAALYILWFIE